MNIRRARQEDIPRIMDLLLQVCMIHHQGRPDLFKPMSRKYTAEQLAGIIADDKRPVFVAADSSGKVQGYAFCVFVSHAGDNMLTDIRTLYIDDLCVDENMRGKHIGKALFGAVKDYARENGCYNLTLNVWSCNTKAMKFYESCGLKPQKTGMETIL